MSRIQYQSRPSLWSQTGSVGLGWGQVARRNGESTATAARQEIETGELEPVRHNPIQQRGQRVKKRSWIFRCIILSFFPFAARYAAESAPVPCITCITRGHKHQLEQSRIFRHKSIKAEGESRWTLSEAASQRLPHPRTITELLTILQAASPGSWIRMRHCLILNLRASRRMRSIESRT